MNTNIELKRVNGEVIKAELISYFEYVPNSKKYVFYTLNEKVENDLVKMYVSEVSNGNALSDMMSDEEWTNIKGIMKSILTSNNNEKINILKEEKYNNQSTYQNDRYLVIPDYDSSYYFKKIYIYDTIKNNLSNITFNYEISYNLLYLGTFKNKLYFLDLKNKNEYELNLKKKTSKWKR